MAIAGLVATLLVTVGLAAAWRRVPRPFPFGVAGGVGLIVFVACGCLLTLPMAKPSFLGPLAWSGYVLAADSAVFSVRGRSILRSRPDAFLWLAVLSIFLWLPFEWYNLRLAAWYRAGLPAGLTRYVLLGWTFACIGPALFETADLLLAAVLRPAVKRPAARPSRLSEVGAMAVVGASCLSLPLLLPRLGAGEHLYALTPLGFLLVFDASNLVFGRSSLWRDWVSGDRSRCVALAAAGAYCGLTAECLNFWADAKWHWIATLGANYRLFELPVVAYLGFPLFGLESFAAHTFATGLLNRPAVDLPFDHPNPSRAARRSRLL